MKSSDLKKFVLALTIGVLGGWTFSLIRMPLPWTLGPLAAGLLVKARFPHALFCPKELRNIAMGVLGYALGRSFTPDTGHRILGLMPYLITFTLISFALSLVVGVITSRFSGVNLATGLVGSIPGGLSQMAMICEDIPGTDVSAVILMQTIRMLVVVFLVPMAAIHGLSHNSVPPAAGTFSLEAHDGLLFLMYTGVILAIIFLTRKINLTGRYVVLPIVGTAILTLFGTEAPAEPAIVIKTAQVFIGLHLSMGVNTTDLKNWKKVSMLSILGNVGLIAALFAADYVFVQIAPISLLTAFISTAPGGMAEMGLTAMTVKADISTVVAFQLFRLLGVLLAAIPALAWWLRRYHRRHPETMKETEAG